MVFGKFKPSVKSNLFSHRRVDSALNEVDGVRNLGARINTQTNEAVSFSSKVIVFKSDFKSLLGFNL